MKIILTYAERRQVGFCHFWLTLKRISYAFLSVLQCFICAEKNEKVRQLSDRLVKIPTKEL